MSSILYTGGMVLLWVIALLNGTGLGMTYHTTEYARILALAVALLLFLWNERTHRSWQISLEYFLKVFLMAGLFFTVSYMQGYEKVGLECLWAFLITYIVSLTRPSHGDLYMVGIAFAALGLVILFIFNYMTALDGWNPNSIAMIGLFSYLVFTIPFYGIRDVKSMIMISLVGAAYVFLLWPTDSRSCSLAIVLDLLIVFRVIPLDKILAAKWRMHLALQIPLLVALFGCALAITADMNALNSWSLEEFGKTLFSGREETWRSAFTAISDKLVFGSGYVDSGTYHNSAVACLVAYGVVGYGLWIGLFATMLREALPWREDICTAGAMSAFFVIFWQQAVELGLFSGVPNLIPYAVLGVMLARARTLEEQQCQELV